MPVDFAALARSIRAVPGVRVCLVVSRDGLALAVAPEELENEAIAASGRLAALGDVEKGFVSMGGEQWVFSRRGPYGALAVCDPTARPGVILAELDQVLLAADEDRVRGREEIRTAPPSRPAQQDPAQAARFRAPLHRTPAPPTPAAEPAPVPAPAASATSSTASARARPADHPAESDEATSPPVPRPAPPDAPVPPALENDWSVDVVEISREFGGLYGESGPENAE
jgi:hypothetical protein